MPDSNHDQSTQQRLDDAERAVFGAHDIQIKSVGLEPDTVEQWCCHKELSQPAELGYALEKALATGIVLGREAVTGIHTPDHVPTID
jgi:hypothetical protein